MRNILVIFSLLILTGCGQTIFLTKEKPIVIMPDKSMFQCPDTVVIPNIGSLTDVEVAQIIIELKTDLEVCRNKNKDIEMFLIEAKKRLEK
jgi:hypothetical protein